MTGSDRWEVAGGGSPSSAAGGKDLVILFGPPAVGKMAVGMELERLTGLRLFHNHMTIDLALRFFPWGDPAFHRLVSEFRTRIFQEVAASTLPGLIFTYVWALGHEGDRKHVDELSGIFRERGARIHFVELYAPLDERLRRNETELRLAEKRPKRDLEHSRRNLLDAEELYQMNTAGGDFYYPAQHLRIDNTHLPPHEVARRVAEHFGLPLAAPAPPRG
ncbi:MAG TPA: AAA family ATPase [Longimicrobium sp.]